MLIVNVYALYLRLKNACLREEGIYNIYEQWQIYRAHL